MKKHALKVSDHKRLVTQKLHILVVEDNDNDYALLLAELKRADIDFESVRVQVRDDFNRQLKDRKPDLIISDYMLPKFTGLEALHLAQKFDPFIPVIICTGSINEETAVECIKAGAADYVLKEQMSRFGAAVKSALELKHERIENDRNQRELLKLSSAVHQAADSIVITDAHGVIEFVNPTFERTTGYTREEVVGKNPRILKSGHHAKEFYKKLWDTILAGKTFYAEFLNKKKDGTEYYQEEKISPILDENGRVTHFVSTGRDITERKKAQEALRQSEERYRQVVESASEIIFTTDLSGRFTNANRAALRTTGFTLDELRRHKYTDLVLPEYRKKLRMLYMRQLVGREPASYVEYPFRVKSGDTKWFGQTGSLLTLDEKVAGFNLIARDITARKLAEEALRRSEDRYKILFEQNPECMWVFDPGTLRFLAVNQAAIECYGYSREEFLGMTIKDIRPEGDVPMLERNVAGNRRRTNVREEWKHRKKDGTVFDVEVTAHDILFEGTKARLVLAKDVTERKLSELALQESAETFASLFNSGTEGFVIHEEGKIVEVNATLLRVSGFAREGLIGKSVLELVAPPSRGTVTGLLGRGSEEPFEIAGLRRDGSWVPVELSTTGIRFHGKTMRLTGVRDITERKTAEEAVRHSEERLRLVWDRSGEGMRLTERGGHIVSVNDAYCRLVQKSRESLLGQSFSLVYKHEGPEEGIEEYRRRFDSGEIQLRLSAEITLWNDKVLDLDIVNSFIESASGEKLVLSIFHDVTEQRRAEANLRKSEERFRALFEFAPDAYYLHDLKGTFVDGNKAAERITGFTRDQLIGKNFFSLDLLSTEHLGYAAGLLKRNIQGMPTGPDEFPLRNKSGQVIPIEVSTYPVTIGNERLVLGIARDVSERKKAEEQIREQAALLDITRDAVVVRDASDIIVYWNKGAERLYGWKAADAMGKTVFEVLYNGEDGRKPYDEAKNAALRTGEWEGELHHRSRSGKSIVVQSRWTLMPTREGTVQSILVVNTDVTDKKVAELALRESEERFRSIYQSSPIGIASVGPEGKFVRANTSYQRIVGYTEEELRAKSFNDVTLEEDRPIGAAELRDLVAGRRDHGEFEKRYVRKNGDIIWVHLTVSCVRDPAGRLLYTVTMVEDISERKKAEERQRVLEAQLAQAQKMEAIGTLAGGIAHDFNNILGIILGHATLIGHTKGDPEVLNNSIDTISKSVQRGAGIVRQILTFARKTESSRDPADVNKLVDEMAKMLRETMPKTIEIAVQSDTRAPIVTVDQTQFQQALMNLCVNARDAMAGETGPDLASGKLTIRIEKVPRKKIVERFPEASASEYVAIAVSDTGMGMDEETKSKIFEPFFTTKEVGKGTGLGLAVVYGVVTSHGGFVDVQSEISRGTTFTLYFPSSTSYTATQTQERKEDTNNLKGAETVLVVEDEEGLLSLVAGAIKRHGYTVLSARDGLEALEQFEKHKGSVDVVITDIGLPKMDGKALFSALKSSDPGVRVILASGYLEPLYKSELLKAGAREFIQKPYQPEEVLKKIREILDGK